MVAEIERKIKMKKVLIICAAGMSSSLIAKKTTDFFKEKNVPIELDATTVSKAPQLIQRDEFDFYLVSPQAKMSYETLAKEAQKAGKPIDNIPPQSYIPTEAGITSLAKQVFTQMKPLLQSEK